MHRRIKATARRRRLKHARKALNHRLTRHTLPDQDRRGQLGTQSLHRARMDHQATNRPTMLHERHIRLDARRRTHTRTCAHFVPRYFSSCPDPFVWVEHVPRGLSAPPLAWLCGFWCVLGFRVRWMVSRVACPSLLCSSASPVMRCTLLPARFLVSSAACARSQVSLDCVPWARIRGTTAAFPDDNNHMNVARTSLHVILWCAYDLVSSARAQDCSALASCMPCARRDALQRRALPSE